jgi:hypothetical protein
MPNWPIRSRLKTGDLGRWSFSWEPITKFPDQLDALGVEALADGDEMTFVDRDG